MAVSPSLIVRLTLLAALVVFCGVQDRITAAGARRYAALQRDALADGGRAVTIDEVVAPAVSRSVRQGLMWAGAVCAVGFVAAIAANRVRS
jgi:hypothetical protein